MPSLGGSCLSSATADRSYETLLLSIGNGILDGSVLEAATAAKNVETSVPGGTLGVAKGEIGS